MRTFSVTKIQPFKACQQGGASISGTCKYGDIDCVYKQMLNLVDFGYKIEEEASRILSISKNFYKVLGIVQYAGKPALISEFVNGIMMDIYLKTCTKEEAFSLFLQMLCVINLIHIGGISHNDLHTGNIIVVPTNDKLAVYDFCGKIYSIPTFGSIPVVIDFGWSNIKDFNIRPSVIPGGSAHLGYTSHDIRYDFFRICHSFANMLSLRKQFLVPFISYIFHSIVKPAKLDMFGSPAGNNFPRLHASFKIFIKNSFNTITTLPILLSQALLSWPFDNTIPTPDYNVVVASLDYITYEYTKQSTTFFLKKITECILVGRETDNKFYDNIDVIAIIFRIFFKKYVESGMIHLKSFDDPKFQKPTDLLDFLLKNATNICV